MPRVINKYKDEFSYSSDTVYIGRPSKWGNPFQIGVDGDRDTVVEKYKNYLLGNQSLLSAVKAELKGKNLVCFCSPKPCHGDVLLEIANGNE